MWVSGKIYKYYKKYHRNPQNIAFFKTVCPICGKKMSILHYPKYYHLFCEKCHRNKVKEHLAKGANRFNIRHEKKPIILPYDTAGFSELKYPSIVKKNVKTA
jgi:hypothetical protein